MFLGVRVIAKTNELAFALPLGEPSSFRSHFLALPGALTLRSRKKVATGHMLGVLSHTFYAQAHRRNVMVQSSLAHKVNE